MKNIETGKIGEDIACQYLLKNSYLILARNHRERFDEIDILTRDPGGVLVFCEVKTSNYNNSGFMPEDNLSSAKRHKMIRAANIFLARHPELVWENAGWQIDLVAIVLDGGKLSNLRHYKNI
ncbi:MAG: YraN family protein [Minisyncoccia bacterium]|jgi:putative endonuclease